MSRFLSLLACCALAAAVPAVADDGDPDTTFSADGKAVFSWPASYTQVESAAVSVLPDGAIVTGGWVDNGSNDRDFAAAKFTRDGAVDTTFGTLGSVVVPFNVVIGGDDRAVGVFAQADGSVLVVGSVDIGLAPYRMPATVRLLPNGQPDPTFGPGGKRIITTHPWGAGANFIFTRAARQNDGKILLAGTCGSCPAGSPADLLVVRLQPDGSVDTGFANQGWFSFGRIVSNSYQEERINDLTVESNGRILIAGYGEDPNDPNERRLPLVVAVSPNGTLDTDFGDNGASLFNILGSWEGGAIASTVRTIAGGFLQRRIFLAINLDADAAQTPASLLTALDTTGDLIDTFGTDGLTDLTREEGTRIRALAVRSDQTVTAAGWIDRNGASQYDFFIARTLFDGTLDTRFDSDGFSTVPFDLTTNSYDRPTAMTLSAQRPVIVGNADNLIGTQRWNTALLRLQSDRIFAAGYQYQ